MLDLWSSVSEASRRHSTATGESDMTSLEESYGANLSRMHQYRENASLNHQQAQTWSEQAARVRTDAQAIDRELGQPFFNWLSTREGADSRPIGVDGAMRLASPQTPEDAEELRQHAASFIAERFSGPARLDPASVPGQAEYEAGRDTLGAAYARETAAAYGGWAESAWDRAAGAGVPRRDEIAANARNEQAGTVADMVARAESRVEQSNVTSETAAAGRTEVVEEREKPFMQQTLEEVPLVGGWLSEQFYGSARNTAP